MRLFVCVSVPGAIQSSTVAVIVPPLIPLLSHSHTQPNPLCPRQKDLIHWQRLPPPIQPVTTKTWDGSISILDAADGGPLILYDAQDGKMAGNLTDRPILGVARLADPNDKYLNKWVRDSTNPVKFEGAGIAFPGQVWKNGDYWNFVGQGARYQSNDSKFHTWTRMNDMVGHGENGGQWWVPVPAQIGGAPPPADVPNYLVNIGGGNVYLFGDYDNTKETFTPWEQNGSQVVAQLERAHAGWWGGQMANDRMFMIGWATPDYHGPAGPGIGFLTRLTLLREVNFDLKTNNLVSNPIPELVGLRSGTLASESGVALPASPAMYTVKGTEGGAASSADVNITFKGLTDGATFGACVLSNGTAPSGLGVSVFCTGPSTALSCTVAVGTCAPTAVAAAAPAANVSVSRYMPNTNFPHGDIFDHEFPSGTNWTACQSLCDTTAACHAWTFLKRGGGMSCCIKGDVENDGCPAPAQGMESGAKVAGSVNCNSPRPGPHPHPPAKSGAVPLFGATEINVRITPDRSVADFFVAGGRWSGTLSWLAKEPRAATASTVSVWSDKSDVTADIDVFGMGCGWLTPSYTESPTI